MMIAQHKMNHNNIIVNPGTIQEPCRSVTNSVWTGIIYLFLQLIFSNLKVLITRFTEYKYVTEN